MIFKFISFLIPSFKISFLISPLYLPCFLLFEVFDESSDITSFPNWLVYKTVYMIWNYSNIYELICMNFDVENLNTLGINLFNNTIFFLNFVNKERMIQ